MAKKRYDDVSQMVRDISESQDFSEAFEKRLSERRMMKELLLVRTAQGLSQEDVAEKMGCTQSKVSKLEASTDGEIQVDDLVKYAMSIGLRPQFLFFKNMVAADMIKHHFFETKGLMQKLAGLACTDPDIAKGVAKLFQEAVFNYFDMLVESAKALPKDVQSDLPLIRLITDSPGKKCIDESDEPAVVTCTPAALVAV